jgi:anti-sigma B factor antagonist
MTLHDAFKEEAFELAVWRRDTRRAVILLRGELDLAAAPTLRNCLAELTGSGVTDVEVDLAGLRYIDSTGISVLVTYLNRMKAVSGTLVVRNANENAIRVFELTGLTDFLSVSRVAS